jgi:hypothetical protein
MTNPIRRHGQRSRASATSVAHVGVPLPRAAAIARGTTSSATKPATSISTNEKRQPMIPSGSRRPRPYAVPHASVTASITAAIAGPAQ